MRTLLLVLSFVLLTACGRTEVSEKFYLQNTFTYEEAAELQGLRNGNELVKYFQSLDDSGKYNLKRSTEFTDLRVMLHMNIDTVDIQRVRAVKMIQDIVS